MVYPKLINNENELVPDAKLHCEEWSTPSIDWRYFTHSIAPTVAAHAQEVAKQAADARAASTEKAIDADDDEYLLSQANKPTRERHLD